jgi:hypothetical protein
MITMVHSSFQGSDLQSPHCNCFFKMINDLHSFQDQLILDFGHNAFLFLSDIFRPIPSSVTIH